MPLFGKVMLVCATLLLFAATGLGAYASHALQGLDPQALTALQTAIDYQFFHGLGLLAVGMLIERHPASRTLRLAGCLFVAGVMLFCGAIYAARLGGLDALGRLAPVGGSCLMAAWLTLGWSALRLPAQR